MLKITGVFLIFCSIAAVGFFYSSALQKRTVTLSQLCRFVSEAETKIRYTQSDIFTIISAAELSGAYSELEFFQKLLECRDDWRKERIAEALSGLHPEDAGSVKEFFSLLGQSDCEGQMAHCRAYADIFSSSLKKAEHEKETKGRLSRSLALLAAAGVVVLII